MPRRMWVIAVRILFATVGFLEYPIQWPLKLLSRIHALWLSFWPFWPLVLKKDSRRPACWQDLLLGRANFKWIWQNSCRWWLLILCWKPGSNHPRLSAWGGECTLLLVGSIKTPRLLKSWIDTNLAASPVSRQWTGWICRHRTNSLLNHFEQMMMCSWNNWRQEIKG